VPWSPAQNRLFEGIAHGSIAPKAGLTQAKASQMASEGVKKSKGAMMAAKLKK
jgi:hypothetical protein